MDKKIFSVVGNPVGNSIYPFIFRKLFEYDRSGNIYTRIAADTISDAFSTARLVSVSGLNIESPFRLDAFSFADITSANAENIGAVNAVLFSKGEKYGLNTEYLALEQLLSSGPVNKPGKVIILGVGADSKSLAFGFNSHGWEVVILNSTLASAVECSVKYGGTPGEFNSIRRHLSGASLVILTGVECAPGTEVLSELKALPVMLLGCSPELEQLCRNMNINIVSSMNFKMAQVLAAYSNFTGNSLPGEITAELREILGKKQPLRNIISFVGFSSSGKTRCGRALAEKTGVPFADLDEEIERQKGKSIVKILEEDGFEAFAASEKRILEKILRANRRMVLACGSDTVLSSESRNLIKKMSYPVWLVSTSEMILKTRSFMSFRPVEGGSMIDAVNRIFGELKTCYADASELVVRSDINGTEKVAETVIREIESIKKAECN